MRLRASYRRHVPAGGPGGARAAAAPPQPPQLADGAEPTPRDPEAFLESLLEAVVGKEPFWQAPQAGLPASAAQPGAGVAGAADAVPAGWAAAGWVGLFGAAAAVLPAVAFMRVRCRGVVWPGSVARMPGL